MAPQKGQAPNAQQRKFNEKLPGAQKDGLRAARQIARSRQFVYAERNEPHCIQCLGPRDRRAHPVCSDCTKRRLAGLR